MRGRNTDRDDDVHHRAGVVNRLLGVDGEHFAADRIDERLRIRRGPHDQRHAVQRLLPRGHEQLGARLAVEPVVLHVADDADDLGLAVRIAHDLADRILAAEIPPRHRFVDHHRAGRALRDRARR